MQDAGRIWDGLCLDLVVKGDYRLRRSELAGVRILSWPARCTFLWFLEGTDEATWRNYISQANELTHTGQYTEAQQVLMLVTANAEKLGPHPRLALSLNNLGIVYRHQGRFLESQAQFERSLAMWEQSVDPEDPRIAGTLHNLASLHQALGRYGKAAMAFERALQIEEKALGPEHPELAKTLSALASLRVAKGDYPAAERLCRRALGVQTRSDLADTPDSGTTLTILSTSCRYQGNYAAAGKYARQGLRIMEKALLAGALRRVSRGCWDPGGQVSIAE